MDDRPTPAEVPGSGIAGENRLESWKRIASYLKRDVTTVQRWERREAMPVHRHRHAKLGSVYAYKTELDAWWASRGARLAGGDAVVVEAVVEAIPRSEEFGPATGEAVRGSRTGWGWGWIAGATAVLLVLGLYAWHAHESGAMAHNALGVTKIMRITLAGTEQAAAMSHDGRFVAYLADNGGRRDAWLTELGSGRYRNLTNGQFQELKNSSIRTVAFNADDSFVSVWTRRADGVLPDDIRLMGAPVAGGPLQPYLPRAAEFDWSPDGKQVVFHTTAPGDPLFVRGAGESEAHQIYVAPPGVHCHFPTWAADGAFIYFVRGEPPDAWDVWRIRPGGAAPERLTFQQSRVTYPVSLDARTLLYLATERDGSGPWMYALDVASGRASRVSSAVGSERYTSLSASANGRRLAATVAVQHSDLWRVTLGGTGPWASAAVPVAAALQNSSAPRFGRGFLVFGATSGGKRGIYRLANDTVTEIWSDAAAERVGVPSVAPDGERLAFTVTRHGTTQLYVMGSEGGGVQVIAGALELRGNLAWAPDGKSLVGALMRGGEPRLARLFVNGSPPQFITADYSLDPVWSADGKYFVYSGADVGTTFPVRAAGPDGRPYGMPSLILTRGARRVAFAPDSGSLVVQRGEMDHKNFWLWDPKTGTERQLTDLPGDFVIGEFDVSPDGREIVFERLQESSSIAVIERQG